MQQTAGMALMSSFIAESQIQSALEGTILSVCICLFTATTDILPRSQRTLELPFISKKHDELNCPALWTNNPLDSLANPEVAVPRF